MWFSSDTVREIKYQFLHKIVSGPLSNRSWRWACAAAGNARDRIPHRRIAGNVESVEPGGVKFARLVELPPYHYGTVFEPLSASV
jgi:hypothetical protein